MAGKPSKSQAIGRFETLNPRSFAADNEGMEMADVILVFQPGQCDRLDDEALAIGFGATNVERPAPGVVACTVPAARIHLLERDARVAYVRRVQVYTGSFGA